MSELLDLDATGQAELVRRREISAVELAQASIDAIERLNPTLDILLHRSYELALEAAKDVDLTAPFAGVPILLKDIEIHAKGMPFSHGSMPFLRKNPVICDHDSNLAADFRKAGMLLLGRSNCSLQAFFGTHDIEAHVMPKNPWNPDYSTAGSSSGSAAAVASRAIAIGHGGDGGGSIRLPASINGVVGMKPTRGRVSVGPHRTEVFSFGSAWSHEFAMTRSVRDTATLLTACDGWRPGDSFDVGRGGRPVRSGPLRIGLSTETFSDFRDVDPQMVAAAEQAAKLVESLGHQVELVTDAPRYGFEGVEWDYGQPGSPHFAGVARLIDKMAKHIGREVTPEDVGPQMWLGVELGRSYNARQMLEFYEFMQDHITAWDRWWGAKGLDVLLTPTVAVATPPITDYLPPPYGTFVISEETPFGTGPGVAPMIAYTQIFNWTGQPAISLPLYESDNGLPLGIHLAAARQDDEQLLQLAFQLEEALPWAHRRPQVCA
jgi:amidase